MRIHPTGRRGERTVRRTVATAAMAIGVVLFGIAVAPGVASAHHPEVSGVTSCRTGDTWTVNWTATSAQWKNYWTINTTGWSPGGWQSWTAAFTSSISYPASQASATTSVSASWSDSSTGSNPVHGDDTSGPVERPPLCEEPTTTTTTEPEVTTTTTEPEVTTTTTEPEVTTTTTAGESTTTTAATTTTVEQAGPTTTASVGQQGPTSSVDQSSGASTTQAVGGSLPATGSNNSTSLIVIALTLIGVGAVMLRLTSQPTR